MSRRVRENILTTAGNHAIFAGGQNVFTNPHELYGGPTIVPVDGQLVVYDNQFGVSLDAVSILGKPAVTVAVARDSDGDGVSDKLFKNFGDKLFADFITNYTTEPCRCAIQEVTDILYNCTHCDQAYTLTLTIEDDVTQNQYPYNRPESITYTTSEACCSCSDCPDDSDNACKITQNFVNQINGVLTTDPTKVSTFSRRIPRPPVTAVRLWGGTGASRIWRFDPVEADGCTNCSAVDRIKSFTYNIADGNGLQTVVFTNAADPSAPTTQTLIGQLSGIVAQINIALDGKGSAVLRRGVVPCCPIYLEINSCATTTVTLLDNSDVVIPVDSSSNPLAPVETGDSCVNCGDQTAVTTTFDYGIRLIADSVVAPTGSCYIDNRPKGILWRRVNVYPSGGFACGGTFVRKVQKIQIPEGLGYQWERREWASNTGGSGRDLLPYDKNYGSPYLPGAGSRSSEGFVDSKEFYCPYIIEHGLPNTHTSVNGPLRIAKGRTIILVPNGDTVTQASIESVLGPWILSANNVVTRNAVCGSDQDQTQNSGTDPVVEGFPDANGMIY